MVYPISHIRHLVVSMGLTVWQLGRELLAERMTDAWVDVSDEGGAC